MGRLISKTVKDFAESNNIDLGQITGTGKNGNVLKQDLVTYLKTQVDTSDDTTEVLEAEVIEAEFNYDSVIETDDTQEAVNTEIRMYQLNAKTGDETWNLVYNINAIGEIDGRKLARAVAKKLHQFTSILANSGVPSSFSMSKPLWFHATNGKQKLDFNSTLASNWKIAIKGKRGKNIQTQSELIRNIETLFTLNAAVASMDGIYKELPSASKQAELK